MIIPKQVESSLVDAGKRASIYRWIVPVVFAGMLTLGWFVTPADFGSIQLCFFKRISDLDCPGCGLTRAFLLLARGHITQAIQLNAASPFIYILFTQIFVSEVRRLVTGRVTPFPRAEQLFRDVMGGGILMILLGHWIVKTGHYFENHPYDDWIKSMLHQGLRLPW